MPNQNPYYIPPENRVPVVEIREIDYQVPSWEEFVKAYQEDKQATRLYEDIFQAEICQGSRCGPGNFQSRESLAENRTEFTIIGKETRSGRHSGRTFNYVKFELGSNLQYEDGEYGYIAFANRRPFNEYEIDDSLWIKLDKVRNKNSEHKFDDDDVAVRESWNAESQRRAKKIAAKAAIGTGVTIVNAICPDAGDLLADGLRIAGFATEAVGNFSGDKNVEEFGEILETGGSLGAAGSRLCNNFVIGEERIKKHRESCPARGVVDHKGFNKTADAISDIVEIGGHVAGQASKLLKF